MNTMTATTSVQATNASEWVMSFFIPRIDFNISKTQVRNYFEETRKLGKVGRVDFVSFNSETGVGRRAFIHFDEYTNLEHGNAILQIISLNGFEEDRIGDCNVRILKNKNPVPRTQLNFDQVASNIEFIAEDVKRHEELYEKINTLEEKLKDSETKQINIKAAVDALKAENQELRNTMQYFINLMQYSGNINGSLSFRGPGETPTADNTLMDLIRRTNPKIPQTHHMYMPVYPPY